MVPEVLFNRLAHPAHRAVSLRDHAFAGECHGGTPGRALAPRRLLTASTRAAVSLADPLGRRELNAIFNVTSFTQTRPLAR
jgi:hypothetical protein